MQLNNKDGVVLEEKGAPVKRKLRWGPPGWPWELELLALVFVIISIVVPYYLQFKEAPESGQTMSVLAQAERQQQQQQQQQQSARWRDLEEFFWAIVIVGLYIAHLAIAAAGTDYMSTPFTHLFSPLVFSMITYFRLFEITRKAPAGSSIVSGSPLEIACWVLGILVITFMVARIRMARYMLNFKNVDWEIASPTKLDNTYLQLIAFIRPLIYPPRLYRACAKGILIEGWFYAMPIAFDAVQGIDAVQGAGFASSGYCLATSSRSLLRIQVADKSEPILISPRDRAAFLHYCEQRLATKRAVQRPPETRPGTAAGKA